jgi:hypothetical protein
MSCPDWRLLAEQKDPDGWDAAVAHFDSGCRLCRRDALTAEPTLVFRPLRTMSTMEMSPAQEASEVDAVRQAVAAMRTASRVSSIGHRARHAMGWKRWVAAAALAVAALSMSADNAAYRKDNRQDSPQGHSNQRAAIRGPVMPAAYAGGADLPTSQGVDRPGARVYHMDGDGLSVVMIVDESFDV